jgi:hypothetical protein
LENSGTCIHANRSTPAGVSFLNLTSTSLDSYNKFMKSTISLRRNTYKQLVKNAQLLERFRIIFKENYPKETYTDARIKDFERADKVSTDIKKILRSYLKKHG